MIKNIANLLVIDGGEVKSNTDDGVVEGFGIVFGSEEEPDQSSQRDFFTADSFVRRKSSFSVPLYYEHGFGSYREEIGEATLTKQDDGWYANAQIDVSTEAGAQVYKNVLERPHGFSTGALQHLVKREPRGNNTNFLAQWVVGELSLTERPAERKAVVEYVKSLDGDKAEFATMDAEPAAEEPAETKNEPVTALFDQNGKQVWTAGEEAAKFEGKSVDGSVTYCITSSSDDYEQGTRVEIYQWGGVQNFISHLQDIINAAAAQVQQDVKDEAAEEKDEMAGDPMMMAGKSEDFEQKVKEIVQSMLQKPEVKSEDVADKVADLEQQIADLRTQLSTRETDLANAKSTIAQLEILAGARETINKHKGK